MSIPQLINDGFQLLICQYYVSKPAYWLSSIVLYLNTSLYHADYSTSVRGFSVYDKGIEDILKISKGGTITYEHNGTHKFIAIKFKTAQQ